MNLTTIGARSTRILEGPVVFLSVNTPRRDSKDIVFFNPEDAALVVRPKN